MRNVGYEIESSTRMSPGVSARTWFPPINRLLIGDLEIDFIPLLRSDLQDEVCYGPV